MANTKTKYICTQANCKIKGMPAETGSMTIVVYINHYMHNFCRYQQYCYAYNYGYTYSM